MFNVIPAFWQRRSAGPPAGDVTIYEGEGTTGYGTVDGPALTKQTEFLARLTGYAKLTFDDVIDPFTGVYSDGDPLLGVGFVKNTVTATFSVASPEGTEKISSNTSSGRYNTTPVSEYSEFLDPLFAEGLPILPSASTVLSFSTPIAALGFFATDIGDFAGTISLRLTKFGGGTVDYPLTYLVPGDSNLYFWGIVDTTGTTYTQLELIGNYDEFDPDSIDFFGLDDIVYVPASYIIP